MTQTTTSNEIFDQLLRLVELGRSKEAIGQLIGTLDGVLATGGDIEAWAQALRDHPLGDWIDAAADGAQGPTCFRSQLLEITQDLGATRAANARSDLSQKVLLEIDRSARSHQSDDTLGEARQPVAAIVAADLPDRCDVEQLGEQLSKLRDTLEPDGKIYLSSLVPGHLGSGWQVFRSGHKPNFHDEAALEASAERAGLKLTHFRDASDSLIWAVLRRADASQNDQRRK